MSIGSSGFLVSPLSSSSITNFSVDVAGTGSFTGVVTTDGISGTGIIGDPLKLNTSISTTNIVGSGVAIMSASISGTGTTGFNYIESKDFAIGEYLSLELQASSPNSCADLSVQLDVF